MARFYDPYATLEQPPAAPAGDTPFYQAQRGGIRGLSERLRAGQSLGLGPLGGSQIETDPNAFFEKRLGGRLTDLFNPSSDVLEGIRQRYERERGARGRAAQLGLQARGGDIPGAYGVTSILGELGQESDLSRDLGAANLAESERARKFQEDYATRIQQFLMDLYGQYLGSQYQQQAQRIANKGRGGGRGGSIGIGPVTVGFARGGIVTRPTHAVLGEDGPEAVVPLDFSGRDPGFYGPAGDYLSRMQPGPMMPPGPGLDGDASTLPLPPTPYREPEPARPQGILERIGELSRLIHLELGPDAPAALKAIALGAGGVAAAGEHRFKRREEERGRASRAVEDLNKRQQQRYTKELEVAGRAPVEMIQLPDGTYVRKYSGPGTAEITRRNPTLRPPAQPKQPKTDVELGRFVSDTVSRLERAKGEDEITAIGDSVRGVTVSGTQLARIEAAVKAARARIARGY